MDIVLCFDDVNAFNIFFFIPFFDDWKQLSSLTVGETDDPYKLDLLQVFVVAHLRMLLFLLVKISLACLCYRDACVVGEFESFWFNISSTPSLAIAH